MGATEQPARSLGVRVGSRSGGSHSSVATMSTWANDLHSSASAGTARARARQACRRPRWRTRAGEASEGRRAAPGSPLRTTSTRSTRPTRPSSSLSSAADVDGARPPTKTRRARRWRRWRRCSAARAWRRCAVHPTPRVRADWSRSAGFSASHWPMRLAAFFLRRLIGGPCIDGGIAGVAVRFCCSRSFIGERPTLLPPAAVVLLLLPPPPCPQPPPRHPSIHPRAPSAAARVSARDDATCATMTDSKGNKVLVVDNGTRSKRRDAARSARIGERGSARGGGARARTRRGLTVALRRRVRAVHQSATPGRTSRRTSSLDGGRPILRGDADQVPEGIVIKDLMCGDEAAAVRSMLEIKLPHGERRCAELGRHDARMETTCSARSSRSVRESSLRARAPLLRRAELGLVCARGGGDGRSPRATAR